MGSVSRDLTTFLRRNNLIGHLPLLQQRGIMSLDHLQELTSDEIRVVFQDLCVEDAEREKIVEALGDKSIVRFRKQFIKTVTTSNSHFMFISHCKGESGTEATLICSELEPLLKEKFPAYGSMYDSLVFVDSEELTNLKDIQSHVSGSSAVVLLLSKSTLMRPWILVELATAVKCNVRVIPVEIRRVGNTFSFPNEEYFQQLREGDKVLDEQGMKVLESMDISIDDVEAAIKSTFNHIALAYSPHRNKSFRQVELEFIIKECGAGV